MTGVEGQHWRARMSTNMEQKEESQSLKPQGDHVLVPFISDKSSVSSVFLRGLIQGIVYGAIASALFLFFLVVLV